MRTVNIMKSVASESPLNQKLSRIRELKQTINNSALGYEDKQRLMRECDRLQNLLWRLHYCGEPGYEIVFDENASDGWRDILEMNSLSAKHVFANTNNNFFERHMCLVGEFQTLNERASVAKMLRTNYGLNTEISQYHIYGSNVAVKMMVTFPRNAIEGDWKLSVASREGFVTWEQSRVFKKRFSTFNEIMSYLERHEVDIYKTVICALKKHTRKLEEQNCNLQSDLDAANAMLDGIRVEIHEMKSMVAEVMSLVGCAAESEQESDAQTER